MSSLCVLRHCLWVVIPVFLSGPLFAANLKDLLDPDRLTRHVKADDAQKPVLIDRVQKLRQVIADYQWERGKRTCEAILWQGSIPDIRELRELRKDTRKEVDALLDTLKSGLNPKQAIRIDKLLSGKGNILDVEITDIPFIHINNTPLFPDFQGYRKAYRITLPGTPSPDAAWSYADLLRTWTIRSYIPDLRPVDAVGQNQVSTQSDMQTRVLQSNSQARIVRSPLLLSATLLIPDLGREEFELLWEHYPHDSDRDSMWTRYREQNRMEDAIQIRLKMSTPFAEAYLDPSRWIIYLEDSEGIGYEPVQMQQEAFHPIETLEISVPGREIEVTDVFGTYYPYIPGNKETFYLEAPAKVTFAGNEKLLRLFFPGKDFQGQPVVNEKTQSLKLIVQSQETDYGRTELVWELKRPKSKARPEG